jgi:hypothetical protein
MVTNPGAPSRPHHLRALNEPRPVTVIANDGRPIALIDPHGQHGITQIQDTWIIEDEWWRQEINRQYYSLLLDNGTLRTVYHDRVADTWHEQTY